MAFRLCSLLLALACSEARHKKRYLDFSNISVLESKPYLAKYVSYENINKTIPTKGHVVKSFYVDIPKTAYRFDITRDEDVVKGYGYANFRFTGNSSNIDKIWLESGANYISKHNPHLSVFQVPFHLMAEQNALPALFRHKYSVLTESREEFQIQYDVVQLKNVSGEYSYYFVQEYLAPYTFQNTSGYFNLSLTIGEPILKVVAYLPADAVGVILEANGEFPIFMKKKSKWYSYVDGGQIEGYKWKYTFSNPEYDIKNFTIHYNTFKKSHYSSFLVLYLDRIQIKNGLLNL